MSSRKVFMTKPPGQVGSGIPFDLLFSKGSQVVFPRAAGILTYRPSPTTFPKNTPPANQGYKNLVSKVSFSSSPGTEGPNRLSRNVLRLATLEKFSQ